MKRRGDPGAGKEGDGGRAPVWDDKVLRMGSGPELDPSKRLKREIGRQVYHTITAATIPLRKRL